MPALAGEEIWCQLFSEPDAGSDLANLATRAVRDGDEYVVNGSKIWTSGGHYSQFGILIARTDPAAPKHKGISYFICPMDLPGISMSPIVDMTTAHSFNQVFFDDVRIPASLRVGAEGEGWRLAKVTLANERVSLSSGGSLWGAGPSAATLFDLVRAAGPVADPVQRQRLARLWCESEVLRLNRLRTLTARLAGKAPGPEASIQKIMGDEHGQHVMAVAQDLVGAAAMLEGSGPAGAIPGRERSGATEVKIDTSQFPDVDPIWHYGFLFGPALTLGGGTFAVQRNIVAEAVLGLPRDIDVQRGQPWSTSGSAPSASGVAVDPAGPSVPAPRMVAGATVLGADPPHRVDQSMPRADRIVALCATSSGDSSVAAPLGRSAATDSSATTCPGRPDNTTTVSASSSASSMSWVTSTVVRRSWAHTSASHCCRSRRVNASRAPNGSSNNSTGFGTRNVRSNATRCRMPPDSWLGQACSNPPSPNRSISSTACACAVARSTPATSAPSVALSIARFHGSSASRWG